MRGSATNSKTATIAAKILATIVAGSGALACLVPALEMNVAAHAARGGPWWEAAPYIAGVFVAAVAGATLPIAKRHKAGEVVFACLVLGIVAVSFNLKNALTASTLSRAEFSDPRRAQMDRITALENRRKILANSSQQSPQQSSQELRAILAAKDADPIFTRVDRSDRCRNSTIEASAKFCAERAGILAQIARAETAERNAAELAEIQRDLGAIGIRPSVADPVVGNLAAAIGLFAHVDDGDQPMIGWANDLHTALFVELSAALGPMLFVFMIGLLWRGAEQTAVRVGKAARVVAATGEAVGAPQRVGGSVLPVDAPVCVRSFFDGQIVETASGRIGAGELYKAYEASCAGKPVSQNKFGRIVGAVLQKEGTRYPAYIGIAFRGPRLAAVSA